MITNLYDLYIHEIKDLHSAETQILAALPKLAARATCEDLKKAFESHIDETREQLNRLNTILGNRNERAGNDVCEATRGLIKEGESLIADMAGDVVDAGLIAAAQRIEHYEIAGYGTAKEYASVLDFDDDVKLLDETLEEEAGANDKLNKLAMGGFFSKGANKDALVNA
ncbi:MAG: ferritin-like domain-containing protein [Verrucomicrobiales bacterium]|nr:ferritin-like domain-containing protein [Verrucomicrobiales bacterium]